MQTFDVFEEHFWQPLKKFGFTSSFWNINSQTIIFTWIILILLFLISLLARQMLKDPDSVSAFIVISYVKSFYNLVNQTLGFFSYNHFAFITSLFTFILFCNIISIIPWLEEPTTDVNTTLALGLISFLYVQITSIKVNGFVGYVKEFFLPFFLLFPLNVIGELAKIVSISFRLFGNIFGGSIIARLWLSAISGSIITELLGIFFGVNLIITAFFVLFEGFIQAFVFSMLTLTYLSVAIQHEEAH